MNRTPKVLLSTLSILGLSTWGYLYASSSQNLVVNTSGTQIFIQNENSDEVQLQLRNPQGNELFISKTNSSQIIVDLKNQVPLGTSILTASTTNQTQNYKLTRSPSGNISLSKINTNIWTTLFNPKSGLRDRIVATADKQLSLAPDQNNLLKQILNLLAHADSKNNQSVLELTRITFNANAHDWNAKIQSKSLNASYIQEQLKLSNIDLGQNESLFIQSLMQFTQSLSLEQVSTIQTLFKLTL
jgi:hypothetical protein